jgi:hypothetical protein
MPSVAADFFFSRITLDTVEHNNFFIQCYLNNMFWPNVGKNGRLNTQLWMGIEISLFYIYILYVTVELNSYVLQC